MKKWIVSISVLMGVTANAGLLFNYSSLALKDLDQMSKIIQDKVKESQKARGDKVVPLKEALQAVFSRPNEDDMIEKLLSPLKNALEEHDAWESTLKKLTTEAVGALKNPRAFQPVVQVTYAVFLENIVSELKPTAHREFEGKLIKTIQDAKIEITKEAQHERILRVMKETRSPSLLAEDVLKEAAARPLPTPPPVENSAPISAPISDPTIISTKLPTEKSPKTQPDSESKDVQH